jgi:uncharacterized delta-60 repeat protein
MVPIALVAIASCVISPAAWAHDSGFGLVRFGPDGAVDPTFGTDGVVVTRSPARSFVANALALQADGKILVAGRLGDLAAASLQMAVQRYNPDGSLDIGFGADGTATLRIGPAGAEARAITVQPDGKVLVAGTAFASGQADDAFAVARFDTDGRPDDTFGPHGSVTTRVGVAGAQATAIGLRQDRTIVVAGTAFANGATDDDFAVAVYTPDGALDRAFGANGIVTTDFGTGERPSLDRASALAIQPDGKIVVAGTARIVDTAFAVVRYEPNGSPDKGFGVEGKASVTVGPDAQVHALVVQPDGGPVLAGSGGSAANGTAPFALLRFQLEGHTDPSFGTHGLATTTFEGSRSGARTVIAQPDGKLLAGGAKFGAPSASGDALPESGFALARYNGDGSVDGGFGSGGQALVSIGDAGAMPVSLALQDDGKILAAGLVFFRVPAQPSTSLLGDPARVAAVAGAGILVATTALAIGFRRRFVHSRV